MTGVSNIQKMKSKSVGWLLYDTDLCHERVKTILIESDSLARTLPSRNETLTIAVKN